METEVRDPILKNIVQINWALCSCIFLSQDSLTTARKLLIYLVLYIYNFKYHCYILNTLFLFAFSPASCTTVNSCSMLVQI